LPVIREKKHRLAPEFYRGVKNVSFTACVKWRKELFVREATFREAERILLAALEEFECEGIVYLFMPEHAHIIIGGAKETSDALASMKSFKQKSGFWLTTAMPMIRWQKDFYDHIIRDEGDLRTHIKYILENPVRKGIVSDWRQYPFKGSTVFNLEEWSYLM
jgi:REP element-mobilizing transposase RayT